MIHQLKLVGTSLADAVAAGDKNYEIRVYDRDYRIGDMLYQTLYDRDTHEYKRHEVSDYMYVVSYISYVDLNDGEYVVMGIHKACLSKFAKYALLSKFSRNKEKCSIVLYGEVIDNCEIIAVNAKHITVSTGRGVTTFELSDIVWATPSGCVISQYRSVDYEDVDFHLMVNADDFCSCYEYCMYSKRLSIPGDYFNDK